MSGHPVTGASTKDSPHVPPAGWTPVLMRGKDGDREVRGYDVTRAINQIRADRRVKETLHTLASHLDTSRDYLVWPGCQTIANERGVSIRTARRHLRKTEHTKYIRGKQYKGHCTVFELDIAQLIHDGELAKRDKVTHRSERLGEDIPPESQRDVDPDDPHAWLRRGRKDDPKDPLSWVNKVPPGTAIADVAALVRRVGRLVLDTRDATPAELMRWSDRVLECWTRAGRPDVDAWLETVRTVLEAARRCEHNDFRWDLRGLTPRGQRKGQDRTRDPMYVFLPASWGERVELAGTHAACGECGCRRATARPIAPAAPTLPTSQPAPRPTWSDVGAGLMSALARSDAADDNHAPLDPVDPGDAQPESGAEAPGARGPPDPGR